MTRPNKIRLLLGLVIVVVFGQVVTHEFVDWDDGVLIYLNPNIVNHTATRLLHHWEPFNPENHSMYNPMVFTFWWLIAHLSDVQSPDVLGATLNPYLFHAANLLVHWLCACVVFEILRRLKIRDWAAAAGALVFAIHPLQTESVAWASAMKDLLSGFFSLLAIWRYIAAIESEGRSRKLNYWLSTFFFAAALLSKPSTVTVPMIVGAIDWIIYRRPFKTVLLWTALWYAMAVNITFIAAKIQAVDPRAYAPTWAHPLIALDALAFYLSKLVWPIGLRFDYGRYPAAVMSDPHHPLYWTWILPAAVALIIWRSKQRELWLAGAIFVFGLLPVLGLKSFAYQAYTTVADRYVYLSMLGVALAVGWAMQVHKGRMAGVVAMAAIVILGTISFVQARQWTDTQALYFELDNTNPIHLIIIGQYEDDLALPEFRKASQAEKTGDYADAKQFTDEGLALTEKAMGYYRAAIRLTVDNAQGYDKLATDLVQLGRIPEAIQTVKQWIDENPQVDIRYRQAPGRLQGMLGSLYLKNRQFPEAVKALKKSLAEKEDPDVRKTLSVAEKLAEQSAKQTSRPATQR